MGVIPPSSLAAAIWLLNIDWARLVLDSFLLDPGIELISKRSIVVPTNPADMEAILDLNYPREVF
jgi:hypothetical protein